MSTQLPLSCAVCVFHVAPLCRRHAISPGNEQYEVAHWQRVKPTDRCGDGATIIEAEADDPRIVPCDLCMHWFQPDGQPITPDHRHGLGHDWWSNSGLCTRWAPSAVTEEDRRAFWRVTHASDGCGDGDGAA